MLYIVVIVYCELHCYPKTIKTTFMSHTFVVIDMFHHYDEHGHCSYSLF